ncbi:hypothetical protein DMO24_19155 [Modestobacter versicolor]|uniref:Uncharacterized protein n=1 Tax=Modestobacter versicolor TaxID=429133 RepID=A0A323V6N1_9ACTN|nr:hypothetical protein DMO24_19155 [Modestobacter versicolor]
MAVYLVYEKVQETAGAVEYRYGPDESRLTTSVVVDPQDPTAWPSVGGEDPMMPTVVRGIVKRQRATGSWPDRGVIEH